MDKLDVLICYDVDTLTKEGRRRLRRVAQVCKNFGQRVQFSVFECCVSHVQLERLEAKLMEVINAEKDSLRIYTLAGGRDRCLQVYGIDRYQDFDEPMVV